MVVVPGQCSSSKILGPSKPNCPRPNTAAPQAAAANAASSWCSAGLGSAWFNLVLCTHAHPSIHQPTSHLYGLSHRSQPLQAPDWPRGRSHQESASLGDGKGWAPTPPCPTQLSTERGRERCPTMQLAPQLPLPSSSHSDQLVRDSCCLLVVGEGEPGGSRGAQHHLGGLDLEIPP